MDKFKILNNIEDAIIVLDEQNNIVFQNIASRFLFGKLQNFDKVKKYFNFDICLLNPDDIQNITPIDLMLNSNENFYSYTTFQRAKDDYLQISISSVMRKDIRVVLFKDVTNSEKLHKTAIEYEELNKKYSQLVAQNQKYMKLKENAQEQALKMAVLNRISLAIREAQSLEKIISLTIFEIHNLLGAFKTYYARKKGKSFQIVDVFPEKFLKEEISGIEFEQNILDKISSKEILITPCIKECKDSSITFGKNTKRLIIPVFHKSKMLGVIVSFTAQKLNFEDNIDVLESIAAQLAVTSVQTALFDEVSKKNQKLQNTLNELKETQLQLINSEKMASLGQLIAGIAHEINTPLASVNSNNTLLHKILSKNSCIQNDMMETVKSINDIDSEAIKRISNIVKSLKKFVRLDEAELQEADINAEIDLTLQLISHETKNRISIVKYYSKLPKVKCFVNMLNQVFMNILINACQSIPYDKNGQIIINTSMDDNNFIVAIKDNGTGMSETTQQQIFNPGFTTKKIGIGTGLGLAISEKIIQKHKGSITFTTKECEGTEFIIKIPIKF